MAKESIKVKVKPGSKTQDIKKEDNVYIIKLKSRAENNKANLELVKLLKKYFKLNVLDKEFYI